LHANFLQAVVRTHKGRRWRWENLSLLGRVFAANALILIVAFAVIAWTPVTVHRIATPSELVVLAILLVAILAVDLFLLRRTFGPLRRLAAVMSSVAPEHPGRRAESFKLAGPEVATLADALNSMLDRLERERRESGRKALEAQESERSRIARELHDEIGQTLTAVALRAQRAVENDPADREALTEIAETVLASLEDIHRIGRELRPEALDDLGLVNALIALCSRVTQQTAVPIRRELEWNLPELPPETELVIYRVAQEALTNAVRHARGSEVTVSLKPARNGVLLAVTDNGRGLREATNGSGLDGMRERARLIGADLSISSGAGAGTTVTLTVPV
jgi:two-component system sensor histidine kinase UhpB